MIFLSILYTSLWKMSVIEWSQLLVGLDYIIFKSLEKMKSTVNKFDYPTATTHTYKIYKESKIKDTDSEAQKMRHLVFDRQQRELERIKAQNEKQRKKEVERRENKKKIQQQLKRKKKELLQLQKMKNMAIEDEKKSHELAIIRQEEERIQKMENQRKTKENQYNAQNRFLDALRRLEEERDINSKKEKQAMMRRRAAQETQKIQREKAIKFREVAEQKQKAIKPQTKCPFNNYKQPLGRIAYNKIVDYTKTYIHNPNIIVPCYDEQENAVERAERQNSKEREKEEERRAKEEENMRISKERGKVAMQKISMAREYQDYLKEQEEKAKLYNIERIQAGKKNQYTGLKPGTLGQMEANKKIRVQEQFQQMFFGGQNPEWFDRPVNRYNMVQYRLNETGNGSNNETQQRIVNPSRSIGSMGAVISDSHYSFQSESINELTSVKKQEQQNEKTQQKKRVIPLPKKIVEEDASVEQDDSAIKQASKKAEELSYSQSEDESG